MNVEDEPEEAKNILINTYLLAKENGRYLKAGELAMRVGKYFNDNKDESQASYYLNEGIRLFSEAEQLQN